jgi:hypothetical protein
MAPSDDHLSLALPPTDVLSAPPTDVPSAPLALPLLGQSHLLPMKPPNRVTSPPDPRSLFSLSFPMCSVLDVQRWLTMSAKIRQRRTAPPPGITPSPTLHPEFRADVENLTNKFSASTIPALDKSLPSSPQPQSATPTTLPPDHKHPVSHSIHTPSFEDVLLKPELLRAISDCGTNTPILLPQ